MTMFPRPIRHPALFLLFLACILPAAGCAAPKQEPHPDARVEETVLRRDVDRLDLADLGEGRYAYRIEGPVTRLSILKNGAGPARVLKTERTGRRETLTIPAAGALVETEMSDGTRTAKASSRLGTRGELDQTPRDLARMFIDQAGEIPESIQYTRTIQVSREFPNDPTAEAGAANPRIPETLTVSGTIGRGDIDPMIKDAVVADDDPRLRQIFARQFGSPAARMVRAELDEPESTDKYRRLLSLLDEAADDLGPARTGILESRYNAALEARLYAEAIASGDESLVQEYERRYGKDGRVERLEAVRRARLAHLVSDERARADRLQARLDAVEREVRSRPSKPAQHASSRQAPPAQATAAAATGSAAVPRTMSVVEMRNPSGASDIAVFSQPTARSDVVTVLKSGTACPLKAVANDYYLIEYEPSRFGYVHKRFVK